MIEFIVSFYNTLSKYKQKLLESCVSVIPCCIKKTNSPSGVQKCTLSIKFKIRIDNYLNWLFMPVFRGGG